MIFQEVGNQLLLVCSSEHCIQGTVLLSSHLKMNVVKLERDHRWTMELIKGMKKNKRTYALGAVRGSVAVLMEFLVGFSTWNELFDTRDFLSWWKILKLDTKHYIFNFNWQVIIVQLHGGKGYSMAFQYMNTLSNDQNRVTDTSPTSDIYYFFVLETFKILLLAILKY